MSSDKWEKFNLAEITEIIGGGTPRTTVKEYWNGSIPWISVVDFVGDKKYIFRTEKNITQLGLENSSTRILKKGQIVISARGTVGELAILGKDMAFNQSCYGLSSKAITSNDFLYYLLKYNIEQIRRKTNGAVFDTITRETFDHIEINLPPLPTQRLIVEILSALDDKIELNRQTNATLEAIAQTIFKEWFVNFNFPGATGELVDSELGMIPKGWRVGKLGEVCEFAYGKGLKAEERIKGIYPVVGSGGIVGFHTKCLVKGPGIVVGRKGTIGEITWIHQDFFPIDTTFYINDLTGSKSLFFHYFLLKKQDFKKIGSDSAVPGLNRNMAYDISVTIPPLNVIQNFNLLINFIFEDIFNFEQQSSTLSKIRDGLLPKLMSGEIEV